MGIVHPGSGDFVCTTVFGVVRIPGWLLPRWGDAVLQHHKILVSKLSKLTPVMEGVEEFKGTSGSFLLPGSGYKTEV